ncbi:hypothetical protein AVEN_74262-1 [Araneus ventricosus]|uniref:Uncharacterized protein n=1 Tax=Araneus ventricosus TaxID=182803 RepID=A0A4Y2RRX3_ARAVE|nr:hypothetical protein AVEN_74262-1 [Araneus ventricosus]
MIRRKSKIVSLTRRNSTFEITLLALLKQLLLALHSFPVFNLTLKDAFQFYGMGSSNDGNKERDVVKFNSAENCILWLVSRVPIMLFRLLSCVLSMKQSGSETESQ